MAPFTGGHTHAHLLQHMYLLKQQLHPASLQPPSSLNQPHQVGQSILKAGAIFSFMLWIWP